MIKSTYSAARIEKIICENATSAMLEKVNDLVFVSSYQNKSELHVNNDYSAAIRRVENKNFSFRFESSFIV